MSAFIVISVKEELNWIVDGIVKCRPRNPNVFTSLSSGKIKKCEGEDDAYEYITSYYTYTPADVSSGNEDLYKEESKVESGTPYELFSNQIAHFLNRCKAGNESINIFVLDNPVTEEDLALSSLIFEGINEVYKKRKNTNFQLIRVLFSYQLDNPTDVNKQVPYQILKSLLDRECGEARLEDLDSYAEDLNSKILYLDNQKSNGAAICSNKEEHDIMLPRMLCDFMMLLSGKQSSYNISNAVASSTNVFSLGYAECMYYYDDVYRFLEIANRRDCINYLLETENNSNSLDFEKNPIGIGERARRLQAKYAEVPFNVDISDFATSIDKEIDDIVVSSKEAVVAMREAALREAVQLDEERTKQLQINYIKESELLPNDFAPEELEENYETIAEELGIDLSSIEVKDATAKVEREYPLYIDRTTIYNQYLLEQEEGEDYEGTTFDDNCKAYKKLLDFIQDKSFKVYLREQSTQDVPMSENPPLEEEKGCFLVKYYRKLFKREKEKPQEQHQPVVKTESSADLASLRKKISTIEQKQNERKQYYAMAQQVETMQQEQDNLTHQLKGVRLTTHCTSVGTLIDLSKLEHLHRSGREMRNAKIAERWNARPENDRNYSAFYKDLAAVTREEFEQYDYIDWENPFDFIKEIDPEKVIEELKHASLPFVHSYVCNTSAQELFYNVYTDNLKWKIPISAEVGEVSISTHTCSKICMFQILQLNEELIKGLVDCYESQEEL